MADFVNSLMQGDCIRNLGRLDAESIQLCFADPPFNIGFEYDVYQDDRPPREYVDWSRQWIESVHRVLTPEGTFWLAIGDEFAAELKLISQDIGFHCRSWVIWYYTFGVNCKRGFSRSHTHLFHFVKDPSAFTFNADNPTVRIPSARQLVYADLRANPRGRLPDNTWILRPQDLPEGFQSTEDTWYFARVAGTFGEREGFHGCQMPEQLLGRIIRTCSNPQDIVLDPFSGSGTTLAVAKKLGRQWIGVELSGEYVTRIRQRLAKTEVGASLDGPADPVGSAPSTKGGRKRQTFRRREKSMGEPSSAKTDAGKAETKIIESGVLRAYQETHDGCSTDVLLADPELNSQFLDACRAAQLPGHPLHWNKCLLRLRKRGQLPRLGKGKRIQLPGEDAYHFASEVAFRLCALDFQRTLDELFCDPELASQFDALAAQLSPGFLAREYRWSAISQRKRAKSARRDAEAQLEWQSRRLPQRRAWDENVKVTKSPAVYILEDAQREPLYVGSTRDVKLQCERLQQAEWERFGIGGIRVIPTPKVELAGRKAILVQRLRPTLNAPWNYEGKRSQVRETV